MIQLRLRIRRPLGLWTAAVLIALTAGCRTPPKNNPPQEQPVVATPTLSDSTSRAPLQFIEKLTGGARPEESVPWIVAIHGLGDRPSSFEGLFDGLGIKARVVIPRAPQPWGPGFAWFPYRFRDQDPTELARGIETAAAQVAALIEYLRTKDARFADKPIICGFSQGGMISYAVALKYPELIEGAVPISGLITMELVGSILPGAEARPPIRAMHGTADNVVPMAPTLEAIAQLEKKGIAIELKQYDGVRHTITRSMRRQLYDWLKELQ